MTTEELVEKLRRPMFVYTQAMHGEHNFKNHEPLRKGAETRRKKALAEIRGLAFEFVLRNT